MQDPVRSETLFVKTERGAAELEHRALGLSATTRRLLILIDGHRSVAELVHDNARSMDVAAALDQLQSLGLIAERGHETSAVDKGPADATAEATHASVSLRKALIDMTATVLGEAYAARITAKLEQIPDSRDDLVKVIDNCARLIRLTIDEGKAEDFRRQAEIILRAT